MAGGGGGARLAGVLSPAAFEAALAAAKAPPPAVAAAGPESFLRDQTVRAAVAKALGDPDSPDAVVLHGPARAGEPDAPSLAAVLEDVRTPSMFAAAGRKVVVLRRADLLLAEEAAALEAHLAAPVPGSLLVLETEAAPGDRNAPAKVRHALEALAARVPVVSCESPSSEPARDGGPSPLATWVAGRARARGKRLDPADAELLVARSGTVLATLDAAVAAAALHAGAGERISAADLEAVAPRGPAEGTDRFVEAFLAGDAAGALRVLEGIYREGAYPWGAKSPVRGEAPVTFLLLQQARRTARDARGALAGGGGPLPPSLRFGCRDPRKILKRSTPEGLARLLAGLTDFESALKGGVSGGERARFEALVVAYAGTA
jgi:DNA polymerase III delta subunit